MNINKSHIILFVSNQNTSYNFYKIVLNQEAILNEVGMTEFKLNNSLILGLMPNSSIAKIITPILPHPSDGNGIPRCEIYLYVDDLQAEYNRIKKENVKIVSPLEIREWGDTAFYFCDPDGHVIALAEKTIIQ